MMEETRTSNTQHPTSNIERVNQGTEPMEGGVGAEPGYVIANGERRAVKLPCSLEAFLLAQHLLPRSVVVEHNGQAVAPSEFGRRTLASGDRLEIVRVVAGG